MRPLDQQTILVTGATDGLGRALAAELARAGATVLTHGRSEERLGGFAWDAALRVRAALGEPAPRPRPRFGHGAELAGERLSLLGCFHPSQQNTFTGRLTVGMMEAVFERAREIADR